MQNTSASFGCNSLKSRTASLGLSWVSCPVPETDLTIAKRPLMLEGMATGGGGGGKGRPGEGRSSK